SCPGLHTPALTGTGSGSRTAPRTCRAAAHAPSRWTASPRLAMWAQLPGAARDADVPLVAVLGQPGGLGARRIGPLQRRSDELPEQRRRALGPCPGLLVVVGG